MDDKIQNVALPFVKMHGLGNDFAVIDGRARSISLTDAQIRRLSDRHGGIGFDQLLLIGNSTSADAAMRVFNADGGEVGACGNGARCVAALLMDQTGSEEVTLSTTSGPITARAAGHGRVGVDMGPARFGWRDIPLGQDVDTLHLPVAEGELEDGVAVNVGNPHIVFFVADPEAVDLSRHGPLVEAHGLFPEGVNVGVARVGDDGGIRLRVWERGAGLTRACGTGACAARVAAARRGLAGRGGPVVLDGGVLDIEWRQDGHIVMTGPAQISYQGVLELGP